MKATSELTAQPNSTPKPATSPSAEEPVPESLTSEALMPGSGRGISPERLLAFERIECHAWTDLFRLAPASVSTRLGLEVERRGAFVALRAPGIDSLLFNRTLVLPDPSSVPTERDLEAVVRAYRQAGVSRFLVHVPPLVQIRQGRSDMKPASDDARLGIEQWLADRELGSFTRRWVKFVGNAAPVARARSDLRIRVAQPEETERVARILALGLDIPEAGLPVLVGVAASPRYVAVVGCDGDAVVAASLLYLEGEVAYLAGAATLPSHRRRGAQGALIARRLEIARGRHCRVAVSETGELFSGEPNHSYRNLVRNGLSPLYLRDNYAPPGTRWTRP